MTSSVIVLNSLPGIQRDGTPYRSKNYIDGKWVRFYLDLPLKIGGCKVIDQGNDVIIRTLFNYATQIAGQIDTYIGRYNSVKLAKFDLNGDIIGGEIDRTPAGYVPDINNLWDFDLFTSTEDPDSDIIIAHVAPNANDSENTIPGKIYSGSADGVDPLTLVNAAPEVSGGIIFISPVVVVYGNNGLIQWCAPGDLNNWTGNSLTIANTKIIKMLLVRGSVQPQALAWTSNSIISLTYGPSPSDPEIYTFTYTTIDNTITLMSANSIIGFSNQYFWMGLKKFYMFNGVVGTLINTMNSQFLFENIYLPSRAKVFVEIVYPSTGLAELWWHVPLVKEDDPEPSENNHAFIFQPDTKIWFDTPISRAAGTQAGTFPRPIMSDAQGIQIFIHGGVLTFYPIWMHEYGVDQVISPENIQAIQSYFETHIYDLFEGNPSANRAIRNRRLEPDFRMNGDMEVTIKNRFFPSDTIENGRLIEKGPYIFNLNTSKIDAVNSQGRLVSMKFESNEIGGNYHMGKTLLNIDMGDIRPAGSGNSGTGS